MQYLLMKSDEFRRLRRDFDLIEETGNLNINHGSKLLHKFNQDFFDTKSFCSEGDLEAMDFWETKSITSHFVDAAEHEKEKAQKRWSSHSSQGLFLSSYC